ncbi:MAG: hypothetical protein ACR2KM_05405 [Gemmatimonadaceae bacterium]
MAIILLVIGIVVAGLFLFTMTSRGRAAALGAVPAGVYLRAIKQGASAHDAIFDAIQVLRYRPPWQGLSDADLSRAATIFAQLPDPSLFSQIVIAVEESRSLAPMLDTEHLQQFVNYVKQQRSP